MNKRKRHCLFAIFTALMILVLFPPGCKKVDLVRIAAVTTDGVESVTTNQATVYGNLIDLGANEAVSEYGFCWAINKVPTVNDQAYNYGSSSIMGGYYYTMSGLASGTNYSVRAYVAEGSTVTYGAVMEFTTDQGTPPPGSTWLHYDDGSNADGIGLTSGGSFDVAIKFPQFDLLPFIGFKITKVKFYAKTGDPVDYSVTIWEGSSPELITIENVYNPVIDGWTEFVLSEPHPINSNKDLWVGYWVQGHPEGTYPAGVDDGPAITSYGDLISYNDGDTWTPLSELDPPNLDYNWNIQVFITNQKGEEKQLIRKHPVVREELSKSSGDNSWNQIMSKSQSLNYVR